jgi:hypothetical protein
MKNTKILGFFLLFAAALAACQMSASKKPTVFPFASPTHIAGSPTFAPYTISPAPSSPTPQPPTSTPEILISPTQTVPATSTITPPEATTTSAPAPATPATPDPNQNLGGLRFEERFDGNSGWLWGYTETGVVSFALDNGSVLARLEGANQGWRISMGPDIFTAGNQQVQFTGRAEACGEKDEWGFLFRGALTTNSKFNGYVIKLNCAGQVSVDLLVSNKSTPLLNWTAVAAANPGAGKNNTLLVWAAKSELRIYVNGIYIVTINDSTYPSGEYGLYVNDRTNGNAQFRFTDLRVFDVLP